MLAKSGSNKMSATSAGDTAAAEENARFLRRGQGKLAMFPARKSTTTAANIPPTSSLPPEPIAYTSSSSSHARALHFRMSPSPPPVRASAYDAPSPGRGISNKSPLRAEGGGGSDSLNASLDDAHAHGQGGDFRDFERHVKHVHSMFLHSGTSGLANARASSPPPSRLGTTTTHTLAARSPQVDFSSVMQALEVKLAKMTQENITLKTERESLQRSFAEEMARVHMQRERDIVEAKRGSEDEIRRLKDQVRLLDRRQRAVSKHTEMRKERTEIENLHQELQKTRMEGAARDSTWRITVDKLKANIAELTQRNADLEERQQQLSETLRRHAESDWDAERSALHDQIDALATRNRELEMQLSEEREVNAALARLRREAEPYRRLETRTSTSPTRSPVPERPSTATGATHRSPRQTAADIASRSAEQLRTAAKDLRAAAAVSSSQRSPQTHTAWHDEHSRPQQAWTDPKPASAGAGTSDPRVPGVVSERRLDNGGLEQIRNDGSKVFIFRNGTTKEQSADGKQTVRFANGDVKEVALDGTVTYFYREARTTHITYPGGVQLVHFPNNQMEKHFPDGTKEVVFPNKVRKKIHPDGREEFFDS